MKTTAKIELNGVKYPFRFGMRFQRNFMNHFDIDLISDYQKKIGLLEKMNTQKAFDVLGVFIISAINAAAKEPVELDVDDVLDAVIEDNTIIETMVAAFVQSQPTTQKAVGKPKK